jgi:hypothetical protein
MPVRKSILRSVKGGHKTSSFSLGKIAAKELTLIRRATWSGIRESNPRLDLGKVAYYHYTNPAEGQKYL